MLTTMESNELTHGASDFELADDQPFFAPVSTDILTGLFSEYRLALQRIDQTIEVMNGDLGNVIHYFIEGNAGDEQLHRALYVSNLFQRAGAVGNLDSAYWSKALALTDVYACMPQDRKNQWNEQMRNPLGKEKHHSRYDEMQAEEEGRTLPKWEIEPLPHFEEATVRSTIESLLVARTQFLAERVDGIFNRLSGGHVTNTPEGFYKRMIMPSYRMDDGYVHDLRCVIAKFMGRAEPRNHGPTHTLIETSRGRSGKWVVADGGALKLRTYKCGTVHLEVHPQMAYRLNQVLAHLHPFAIPAEFRARPARKQKDIAPLLQPLPFDVIELLCERQYPNRRDAGEAGVHWFCLPYGAKKEKPAAFARASAVLASLGGVPDAQLDHKFRFDYDPMEVMYEVRLTGCLPDKQTHQYYPTPEKLAAIVSEMADIKPEHSVLEPSAGQGDIARHLGERVTCVELSTLHCAVLKARGLDTICADFLEWSDTQRERFDRVVMNPPFADGRWLAHVEAAQRCTKPGGRIVAILPSGARNKLRMPRGWNAQASQVFANEFAGTSVSVVIVTMERSL